MNFLKKLFFVVALGLLTALPASAAILPACATNVNAVLQLSCFLTLLIGISQWILGITGSLALLYFVYGGFLFLTSRGASDQVTKGKTVLTQATIGIIIIFGAYLAINFLVANVLKAKFTTEIPKEATPAPTTVECAYCYCKDSSGTEVPSGTGTTMDACKAACSKAQIGGQGGFSFSKCSSPPSGQVKTSGSIESCSCICANGYQENITGGDVTYSAISQCKSRCIMKKSIMQGCK